MHKVVFANQSDRCFKFFGDYSGMFREDAPELFCSHEEADTRMFYHLSTIPNPSNVVIRTADTDCLIIALESKRRYHEEINIWLEVGIQSANTQRYINVNQLHEEPGESLCAALPGYHAFTGCDYTASFCRKGKTRRLKIVENRQDFQEMFKSLESNEELTEDLLRKFEEFVCVMYGRRKWSTVNEARFEIFLEKYKLPSTKMLADVKKLDAGMLPPRLKVLKQKIKRVKLITRRWMSSTLQHQPIEVPEEYGWKLEDEKYQIVWFEGDATPKTLDVVEVESEGIEILHSGLSKLRFMTLV